MTTETLGIVGAIALSLAFSLLKGQSWSKEAKENLSFWLAMALAAGLLLYRGRLEMQELITTVIAIQGTMYVFYKYVSEKLGIDGFLRGVHEKTVGLTDTLRNANLTEPQRLYLEYSEKANALEKDRIAGRISGQAYATAVTALNEEYRSVFLAI